MTTMFATTMIWLELFLWLRWALIVALASGLAMALAMLALGLRRRRHDRALQLLDAFPAVIEHEDGVRQAGVLRVRTDGVTLEFAVPATGHSPTAPITYLHYQAEFATINAIYRFIDELDKSDAVRRQKQLDAMSDFLGGRKASRFWPWVDRWTDWCIGVWLGLRGKAFPQAYFDSHPLTGGSLLTGLFGDAYNGLLEMHLGKSVVVRHRTGQTLHRRQGVLMTYSPRFLFLAGAAISERVRVTLSPERKAGQEFTLRWRWQDERLEIQNLGRFPLLLDRIHIGDQVQELSMLVSPEDAFTLHVVPPSRGSTVLQAQIIREADMLLPRRRAIVRHAAKLPGHLAAMDPSLALKSTHQQEAEELRLRKELQRRPENAPAAVALARLLAQKGAWHEAERFYEQALAQARNLPDLGERAQLELDQLRVRRAEEGEVKPQNTP